MEAKTIVDEETPERAAESISAALDFLRGEAEAAGLSEVSDLIQQASTKARERSSPPPSKARPARATELEDLCRAIVGLPDDYRKALVFKKVYRRSYEEIANDCSVSIDTAKAQVIKGFQLLRLSRTPLPGAARQKTVEVLTER